MSHIFSDKNTYCDRRSVTLCVVGLSRYVGDVIFDMASVTCEVAGLNTDVSDLSSDPAAPAAEFHR